MRRKTVWLSAAAGAACGAAAYFLKKKLASASGAGAAKKAPPASGSAPVAPKSVREASYSFISGFQDAATVEMKFSYDPERFSFSVLEDEFLTESGDSHVGVLYGEDYSAQFEYGSYYHGDDFSKLRQELSGKHSDLSDAEYGTLTGVKFRAGDNLCLAFPIPEDAYSYLLVTLVKAPDNDDELEALPEDPDLRFMLSSVSFSRS